MYILLKASLASSKICSIGLSARFKHGSNANDATANVAANTIFMINVRDFAVYLVNFKGKRFSLRTLSQPVRE